MPTKAKPAKPAKPARPRNWRSGPSCKVCVHPERARLEMLRAGGASYDSLSRKFSGLSRDQIFRHWTRCVPLEKKTELMGGPDFKLEKLAEKAAEQGMSLFESFDYIKSRLFRSFDAACEAGDRSGQGVMAGRLLETLREIGKLTGEIRQMTPGGVVINNNVSNVAVLSSPVGVELQAMLLRELAPYPDALRSVVSGLRRLEGKDAPPMIDATAKPSLTLECEAVDEAAE